MSINTPLQRIAVIGAGTMGSGIAQLSAQAGYATILCDIDPQSLPKAQQHLHANLDQAIQRQKISPDQAAATLSRLQYTHTLADVQADLVIEAIVENLDIKVATLQQLADYNPPSTILASNTSSLSITRLAARLPHPERVLGMHFFNPAHLMRLVEVVSTPITDPAHAHTLRQLAIQMGKVHVDAADAPGFIVNRVARPYYTESLQLLEEGVADHATIDELLENVGFKMGAFRLMDLIGNDINFAVTQSLFDAFHYQPRFRPSRWQQQKVAAGQLGRKTGKGFYDYGS